MDSLEQEMGEWHIQSLWSKAGKGGVESLCNSLQHARWENLPPLSLFCYRHCFVFKFYYMSALVYDVYGCITCIEAREKLAGVGSFPVPYGQSQVCPHADRSFCPTQSCSHSIPNKHRDLY